MEIEKRAHEIINWGNAVDEGNTALHVACLFSRVGTVEVLCSDPRVDVNKKNDHGETALMMACGSSQSKMIQALIGSREAKLRTLRGMEENKRKLERLLLDRVERQAWARLGRPRRRLNLGPADAGRWRINPATFSFDVDLLATSNFGTTALWSSACFGRLAGVRLVLAHLPEGSEEQALSQKKITGTFYPNTTPLQVAINEGMRLVAEVGGVLFLVVNYSPSSFREERGC